MSKGEEPVFVRVRNTKKTVTAGGDPEDDIVFLSGKASGGHFRFDLKQKTVEVRGSGIPAFLNHAELTGTGSYDPGDVFEADCLTVVFHDCFLMIREDPGIFQCLIPCERTADLPLRYPAIRVRRMHPQILGALPDRIVRVRIPAERPVSLREPSFLVYLPMLMMSLVSALSMTVAALASESFRPVNLIMPAGLLFSQLLILPIRKAVYRKEKEKLEEKEEQRKKDETEAETERIRSHLTELEQISSLCFPGCRELFVQAEKGIAGYRNTRNPAYGKIRFGETTDLCEAELELPAGYDRDSLAVIAGEVRRASRCSLPWIEDLTVYRIICLRRTAMQEPYFCWLLLQMMLYFSPSEFLFVYAGAADATLSRIMAEMPHIRTKEGKRCVIGSTDDAVRVSSWLKQETRKILLFRQADSDYGLDDASDLLFVLDTDEEMFQGSSDLDLTFDEFAGTALDLRSGCERLFRADLRQGIRCDLEKLVSEYRIFSPVQEKQTMYHVLEETGITPDAISENWRKNRAADTILAVAGTDRSGRVILLDLHENGDGPHGLLAGTTGSGKSEMLITLILTLALRYPPDYLQFVLIDFKGGSAAQAFDRKDPPFPHMAGILTDLDVTDMERAVSALKAECRYREQCFRDLHEKSGQPVTDIDAYRNIQKDTGNAPMLAHLLIIVDEFAELKQSYPEFPDELVRIARIGRSLGMHLLLCTQKPSGSVNDQIRSNTAYTICLKTADPADSMEVIRRKDAAFLQEAGSFFLCTDNRFISGTACYSREGMPGPEAHVQLLDRQGNVLADSSVSGNGRDTVLETAIQRIRECAGGFYAPQVWKTRPACPDRQILPPGVFALADDVVHRLIRPLSLTETPERNHLFLTSDRRAKESCLNAVLYAMLTAADPADELFILDDLFIGYESLLTCKSCLNDVIHSMEEERIRVLFRHIRERRSKRTGICRIVITDCTRYYEGFSEAPSFLHDLLEHAQDYGVDITLFASGSGSVYYRDMNLIPDRYYLRCENLSEMTSVLECPVRTAVRDPLKGIYRADGLQEFYLPDITGNMLEEVIRQRVPEYRMRKLFRIPGMPETVCLSEYRGSEIALGIRKSDLQWQTVSRRDTLIVVAEQKEERDLLKKILSLQNAQILPSGSPGTGIRIIGIREYRKMNAETERSIGKLLLYVPGNEHRFLLSGRLPELAEGEALYKDEGGWEVVRVIQDTGPDQTD